MKPGLDSVGSGTVPQIPGLGERSVGTSGAGPPVWGSAHSLCHLDKMRR